MNQPRSLSAATLGALGVVYGDIGTSPLYALREATAVAGGTADVNAMLAAFFADYAALRRYLVDEGFLARAEGAYWRTGGSVDL